jgi:hypothetical protein
MGRAKSHRGLGRASLRHFGPVLLIAWYRRIRRGEHGFGGRDAARPIQAAWAVQRLLAARSRGRQFSFGFLISAPRVYLSCQPYARARADGRQAVVCPLLRGRSPTRWVAPKASTRAIANQSPLRRLVYESPIPKNVYASAIGLCKDSMIMQSREPSNSDF